MKMKFLLIDKTVDQIKNIAQQDEIKTKIKISRN